MTHNFQFVKEDGIAISQEVYIANLEQNTSVWIYTESEDFDAFSPKQKIAFDEFINTQNILQQIEKQLPIYYRSLCAEKRIEPRDSDSFDLDFEAVALPSQAENPKNIVFLLANTNWLLTDSEFFIELEMRFENGKLVRVAELSGEYIFPQ